MNSSSEEEKQADSMLIENRHKFWWFPHMWSHLQPHNFTNEKFRDRSQHMTLEEHMRKNKEFALEHDIPTVNQYSVAPHHSGLIFFLNFSCIFYIACPFLFSWRPFTIFKLYS